MDGDMVRCGPCGGGTLQIDEKIAKKEDFASGFCYNNPKGGCRKKVNHKLADYDIVY
jgi:hypothetical protein